MCDLLPCKVHPCFIWGYVDVLNKDHMCFIVMYAIILKISSLEKQRRNFTTLPRMVHACPSFCFIDYNSQLTHCDVHLQNPNQQVSRLFYTGERIQWQNNYCLQKHVDVWRPLLNSLRDLEITWPDSLLLCLNPSLTITLCLPAHVSFLPRHLYGHPCKNRIFSLFLCIHIYFYDSDHKL